MRSRTRFRCLVASAIAAAGLIVGGLPSQAAYPQPTVVSEDPADDTAALVATEAVPHPRVEALARSQGNVFLGGLFRQIEDNQGTYARRNLATVDEATGQIRSFTANVNDAVYALVGAGRFLYLGGTFTKVNGVARAGLAKIDTSTGMLDTRFRPRLKGRVNDLQLSGGRLFVGGDFGKRLVALNPKTGADTGYVDLAVSGKVAAAAGNTSVARFAIDPTGTRLVAVGNFATVAGQDRKRAFKVRLAPYRARLTDWYYAPLAKRCRNRNENRLAYLTDVDFSPDGSYFVLVSTGFVPRYDTEIGTAVCDAAARFETNIASPQSPTWINYTGGDTIWSVAVTGAAVYVQGHFRWLDNPYGRDTEGPDAVDRRGIGAIDPDTGSALSWDPDKPARIGGKTFLTTETGLWVGSDSIKFAGEPHRGLAFAPLPPA